VKARERFRSVAVDAALFCCLLFLPLLNAFSRNFPYLYPDEYGVLGAGAVLAGMDWHAPAMPYYGFLAGILTAPLHLLDLSPTWSYRLTLSMNALFIACSGLVTLKIIRVLRPADAWSLSFLAVLASYTYPATIYFSSLALGESILLLLFTMIGLSLVRLLTADTMSQQIVGGLVLGVCLGAVPFAHSRGLACLIAGWATLIVAASQKNLPWKVLLVALFSMILSYFQLLQVKHHLLSVFYAQILAGTDSVSDFLLARARIFSTLDGIVDLLRVVVGQIYYLASSTYGMWLLGIILALVLQTRVLSRKIVSDFKPESAISTPTRLILLYLTISVGLVYGVSVLQTSMPERTDHYFYGRYNELLVPAVLTLFLSVLYRMKTRDFIYVLLAGVLGVAALGLIVGTYPDEVFEKQILYAQITGWYIHRQDGWKFDPVNIALKVIACQVSFGLLLLKSRRLFLIALVVANVYVSNYLFSNRHMKVDQNWQEFAALESRLGGALDGYDVAVIGGRPNRPLALQFALPQARVVFGEFEDSDIGAVLDYSGNYCQQELVILKVEEGRLCYSQASHSIEFRNL
jgi:hypothetical protein